MRKQGWTARPASGLGDEELTRQADLSRLLSLAEQVSAGSSVADFLRELEERFSSETQGRGVELLTYHRAKGLEWEAVFLPRLEEKELPYGKAMRGDRLAEERRLVTSLSARTDADDHVDSSAKPSGLTGSASSGRRGRKRRARVDPGVRGATPLASERAKADEVPRCRLPRLEPHEIARPSADARAASAIAGSAAKRKRTRKTAEALRRRGTSKRSVANPSWKNAHDSAR